MRKNFGSQACVYPQPVFILAAYDENGVPNAMNAGWGGITDYHEITLAIDPDHKTMKNILLKKEFTLSMATADMLVACDYVGLVSGNKVPDKMERSGFHTTKAEFIDAPLIHELPMTLECRMTRFNEENDHLYAEIVNLSADESILTDGKIDPKKLNPIILDSINHTYWTMGEEVGKAFHDGLQLK